MKKRLILFGISVILLSALIYFSGPVEIASAFTAANPYYIVLGLLFWVLNIFFRTFRWRYLLDSLDIDIKFFSVMRYYISGLFLSNLSPAKTGEPMRAVFLKKLESKSFTSSMGTIIIEKLMDIASMSLIAIAGLLLLVRGDFMIWVSISLLVYGFLSFFMLYIVFSGSKLEVILGRIVRFFSFIKTVARLEDRVEEFSDKLRDSLGKFRSKKVLINTFVLSFPLWIMEGLIFWAAFRAVGHTVSYPLLLVVAVTALLVSTLTFLPGTLGSGEVIRVALLLPFLNIAVSDITTAVLLARIMNYFSTAVVGAILLGSLPKDMLDFDIFS